MLIIRGVNVFPTQIEELIVRMPTLAPHYVLEVGRAGHLDTLTVRVELAPDAGTLWATPRRSSLMRLKRS